eukprot:scaffold28352_cov34-Tisochrysis_lutea.AAC.2
MAVSTANAVYTVPGIRFVGFEVAFYHTNLLARLGIFRPTSRDVVMSWLDEHWTICRPFRRLILHSPAMKRRHGAAAPSHLRANH